MIEQKVMITLLVIGPRKGILGLCCTRSLNDSVYLSCMNLKCCLYSVALSRGRQQGGDIDALGEMICRLNIRRPAERLLARPKPVPHGGLPLTGLRQVVRQRVRLGYHHIGKLVLEDARDRRMQLLTTLAN